MRIALFLCMACSSLFAQDAVSQWFPLDVGNRWTYEHEWRGDNPKNPQVRRWRTNETIIGAVTIPEGRVVLRRVVVEGNSDGSWLTGWGESHYLLRNGCIYFLDTSYSWDEQKRKLRPEFRESLLQGNEQPPLCFPLVIGKKFGKDSVPPLPWRVRGRGRGRDFTPASVTDNAFDIIGKLVLANTTHLWFEKGVGITGQTDWHNGTYDEDRVRLVRFQPASGVAQAR